MVGQKILGLTNAFKFTFGITTKHLLFPIDRDPENRDNYSESKSWFVFFATYLTTSSTVFIYTATS